MTIEYKGNQHEVPEPLAAQWLRQGKIRLTRKVGGQRASFTGSRGWPWFHRETNKFEIRETIKEIRRLKAS